MTDRINAFIVILDRDIRDDDAEKLWRVFYPKEQEGRSI